MEAAMIAAISQQANTILQSALDNFMPNIAQFVFNATDKVGFDLDVVGRARETRMIEENVRSAFAQKGVRVNIAIWNMHLHMDHQFSDIISSGIERMGNGGGFRVVVFMGSGYLHNHSGHFGYENWCVSGIGHHRQSQQRFTFQPQTGGFDAAAGIYNSRHPDVAASDMDARTHYDQYGRGEGRGWPSERNKQAYLAANPDVARAGLDAYDHYCQWGRGEGRHFPQLD